MMKQYALILGLGLSLGLMGCTQSEADISTELPQVERSKPVSSQAEQSKQDSSKAEKPSERRRPQGGGEGRKPPEAAYAACDNLAAESACTVETPRGSRTGVCKIREGNDRAVCAGPRPEGRRPRPSGQ